MTGKKEKVVFIAEGADLAGKRMMSLPTRFFHNISVEISSRHIFVRSGTMN